MSEKEIVPGAYVVMTYIEKTEEGEVVGSTKRKIKREEKEEEVDIPIVVKVGAKEVFFDEDLVGLKKGEEKELVIPPEKAYGKRDPKKIERVPVKRLKAMMGGKRPEVGAILYTEDGNYYGKIVYVGARDALVDKNHPYADKTIKVQVKIHDIVTPVDPPNEVLQIILKRYFSDYATQLKASITNGTIEIVMPSELTMSLSAWELIREIYARRKSAAEELLKELTVSQVRFIDEFALEAVKEGEKEKTE